MTMAMNLRLRPQLFERLRPGSRVLSHDFDFGDWRPDRSVVVEMDEKYGVAGSWTSTVFLWTVPQPVAP